MVMLVCDTTELKNDSVLNCRLHYAYSSGIDCMIYADMIAWPLTLSDRMPCICTHHMRYVTTYVTEIMHTCKYAFTHVYYIAAV